MVYQQHTEGLSLLTSCQLNKPLRSWWMNPQWASWRYWFFQHHLHQAAQNTAKRNTTFNITDFMEEHNFWSLQNVVPLHVEFPHTVGPLQASASSYRPARTSHLHIIAQSSLLFIYIIQEELKELNLGQLSELQDITLSTSTQNPLPLPGHIFVFLADRLQVCTNVSAGTEV